MKTLGMGRCILWIVLMIPHYMPAQVKEMPVTASSEEALGLFISGRDKLANFEYATAISLFEKAIQKDPDFALAYLFRALSGGGINIFRQNLDKAVSLTDKVSVGEKALILFYQAYADGNRQKQKEYLDQLLKSFPSDKRIQEYAGVYYLTGSDFATALSHYTRSTELDNKYAPAYNMIGYCQSTLGNFQEAENAFKTYIKLVPDYPNAYDSYAELLLKTGRYDESIAQYKKALEKDPSFAFSLTGLGNNYIFKGDYESARKYYQDCYDKATIIELKFSALFSKATSFVHEGKVEKAIAVFDEYRTLAEKESLIPNSIYSFSYQGYVLIETGKPAEGMKYYEKAIGLLEKSKLPEADKEGLLTTSMLWRIYYLSANDDPGKAVAEYEKARMKVESRKNPDEEMLFNSIMGYSEIKRGNYDSALQYLSNGYKENPLVWYYTAVAYDKKGDKQSASKLFEKITKWNVNSLELALVRKRALDELK